MRSVATRKCLFNHYNEPISPIVFLFMIVGILHCSTSSHTWDAFQLAQSSFRLYCVQNEVIPHNSQKGSDKVGPKILGEPPNIEVGPCEADTKEDEEDSPETSSSIKIYDDDVNTRFLLCGFPCTVVGLDTLVN